MQAEWARWLLLLLLAAPTCVFLNSVYAEVTEAPLRHVNALLASPVRAEIKRILVFPGESVWHLEWKDGSSEFAFRVPEAQEETLVERLVARGVKVDVVCSGSTIIERLWRKYFQSACALPTPSASNYAPAVFLLALWMMFSRWLPISAGSQTRLDD